MSGARAYGGLAASVVLGAVMLASAQQIVGGHALDANLRVGSEGLNTRSSRANAPGLSMPLYNPALRAPMTGRAGIQQPVYWTTTSASARAAPRGPTYGGATYSTGGGLVYDPLAAPLYNPLAKPVQVQVGGGTLQANAGQPTIATPRYRPMR